MEINTVGSRSLSERSLSKASPLVLASLSLIAGVAMANPNSSSEIPSARPISVASLKKSRELSHAHNSKNQSVFVIGDSIAEGFKNQRHLNAHALFGQNPKTILGYVNDFIKENHPSTTQVVLSSGISNNNQDFANVRRQIKALKRAGFDNIVLLGVANEYDFYGAKGPEINKRLGQVAQEEGARFTGGFSSNTKDNLHTTNYNFVDPYLVKPRALSPR